MYNAHLGDADEFLAQHMRLAHYAARKFDGYVRQGLVDSSEVESAAMYGLTNAYRTFEPVHGAKWATYALRCIDNEIKMLLRQIRKRQRNTSLDSVPLHTNRDGDEIHLIDILEGAGLDDTRLNVEEFVDSLQPKQREILDLRLQGLNQFEIAERLQLSQSYISRLIRGIGDIFTQNNYRSKYQTTNQESEVMRDSQDRFSLDLSSFDWVQPERTSVPQIKVNKMGIRVSGSIVAKLDPKKPVEIGFTNGYIAIRNAVVGWRVKETKTSIFISSKSALRAFASRGFKYGTAIPVEWNSRLGVILGDTRKRCE